MTDNISEKNEKLHSELISEPEKGMQCDSCTANEKLIIIVIKSSGLAPYSHEFSKSSLDPQIVSGFISAMTSFMGEMMGEQQTHWKTEYGSESLLLVEHGEWAIGVLAVSRETNEARRRLSRVVREFEDCFAVLRDSDGIEGSALRDFDECVRKTFVNDQITERTLVIKRPSWRSSLFNFGLPSTAFAISKILLGFEEGQTVKEISKSQGLRMEDAIDLVSNAYWHDAVLLKYIPPGDDILILPEKSSAVLFQKGNPLGLSNTSLNITARLDGRTPLSEFAKYTNAQDYSMALNELGNLINKGLIQSISSEQRQVLSNESILSSLVSEGALVIGNKAMKQSFEEIRRNWGNQHPRIYRITLTERMRARCIIDENMTPYDLDELSDILELFIRELSRQLLTACGTHTDERLFLKMKRLTK